MRMKEMVLKGVLALSLAAGLLLGTGNGAKAAEIETVEFWMDGCSNTGIWPVGTDLQTMKPEVDTDGVVVVDHSELTTNNVKYVTFRYRQANASNPEFSSEVSQIALDSLAARVEAGCDYRVEFTYKTSSSSYTLPTPCSEGDCVYHSGLYGEFPVSYIQLESAPTGLAARTVYFEIYSCNQGTKSFDLTGKKLVLNPKDSDAWKRAVAKLQTMTIMNTLEIAEDDPNSPVSVVEAQDSTSVDLDGDGNMDLKLHVSESGAYVFDVLDSNSIGGAWSYTVLDNKSTTGVTTLDKTYYKTLTLQFPGTAKTNILYAVIAPIAEQDYTGQAITPAITVTLNGKVLVAGTDYKVSYANNVNEGTATVTITGIGSYTGTLTTTFEIDNDDWDDDDWDDDEDEDEVQPPAKVTISSGKNTAKKKITVKWKKAARAEGYEVAYTTDKKFKKSIKYKSTKKLNATIKNSKFKKKKTVYVKVRAYVLDEDDDRVYGPWSAVKKIKIKK